MTSDTGLRQKSLSPQRCEGYAEGLFEALAGKAFPPKPEDVEGKLRETAKTIGDAAKYVNGLQASLQKQLEEIKVTQAQLEHYKALNKTEQVSAKALLTELRKGAVAERAWGFGLGLLGNAIFLVVGVVASNAVKGWIDAAWNRFAGF